MNLLCALGYKEWVKTRRVWGVSTLLFIGALIYTFIDLNHAIRLEGVINVWYGYIFRLLPVAPLMMWLPSLVGLMVALSQFVPEMTQKRLKLTLHLPATESRILLSMVLFGVLTLLLFFLVFLGSLTIGALCLLPVEVVKLMDWQLLPWMVSGIAVYGFTAWVCIEPQWKQRIFNALIAVVGLSTLYISLVPGMYIYFGWGMIGVLFTSFIFPLYACLRFKNGIQ